MSADIDRLLETERLTGLADMSNPSLRCYQPISSFELLVSSFRTVGRPNQQNFAKPCLVGRLFPASPASGRYIGL
jgi:hypothetical protein